jgi:hypothetical protein
MSARNDYAGDDTLEEARFRGNCKHSGFGEYDNLTGYLTRTYTVEWEDRQGTRWRKTCQVINLGRPDRGIPVDPDGQLGEEDLPEPVSVLYLQRAQAAAKKAAMLRDERSMSKIVAYLKEHGPQPLDVLLGVSEWAGKMQVRDHLQKHKDIYVKFYLKPVIWGLHGQEWQPPAKERGKPASAIKIREVLNEHGPMTQAQIKRLVPFDKTAISRELRACRDWFRVVGVRNTDGSYQGRVYGLVGIHDREAA